MPALSLPNGNRVEPHPPSSQLTQAVPRLYVLFFRTGRSQTGLFRSCATVLRSNSPQPPRYPDSTHNQAPQMAPTVQARPEWLPDEFEHEQVTRQEVWDALDRDARRHFGLTADEFPRICRNPPGRYHGNVIFRSLTYLSRLLDQTSKT